MRIDIFLNKVCLLKSRSMAKEACDRGKITLNGQPAKASAKVRSGDRIVIDLTVRITELTIIQIPQRTVSRKNAPDYYDLIRDERRAVD